MKHAVRLVSQNPIVVPTGIGIEISEMKRVLLAEYVLGGEFVRDVTGNVNIFRILGMTGAVFVNMRTGSFRNTPAVSVVMKRKAKNNQAECLYWVLEAPE